jgi:hypothetical protein
VLLRLFKNSFIAVGLGKLSSQLKQQQHVDPSVNSQKQR